MGKITLIPLFFLEIVIYIFDVSMSRFNEFFSRKDWIIGTY